MGENDGRRGAAEVDWLWLKTFRSQCEMLFIKEVSQTLVLVCMQNLRGGNEKR